MFSLSQTSPVFLEFRYAPCAMHFAIVNEDEWAVNSLSLAGFLNKQGVFVTVIV
jgi:hypothetical protein